MKLEELNISDLRKVGYLLENYLEKPVRASSKNDLLLEIEKGLALLDPSTLNQLSLECHHELHKKIEFQADPLQPKEKYLAAIIRSFIPSDNICMGQLLLQPSEHAKQTLKLNYIPLDRCRQLAKLGYSVVTSQTYTLLTPEKIDDVISPTD